ncbi:diguanylate cyclase (GGDEF) domain-containing protein [Loktanella fryxellensis]|uniref:Diguanylate cyclase (GGDEF) domain-containing protein n=1 Tax=Loktanella fryxellensis TaxID=245187 RepID=A0A1H8CJS1_9RHOB|nr:EAL domain-containing protein [Loktanella fryxellensis]SEM95260.1 diguanylate cyclase (GGDEF) domain-containing protein [Loktanella fryxellensis]
MQIDPDQTADLMAIQQVIDRNVLLPLFEHAAREILVLDAGDLHVLAANDQARRTLGRPMRHLRQMTLSAILPDLAPDRLDRFLARFMRSHRRRVRCRLRHGASVYDVDLMMLPGRQQTLVVQAQNVTDTLDALRQADAAEARLLTAIDALSDGFALFDGDDRLVICNETYRLLYPDTAPVIQPGTAFVDILRYGLARGQVIDGIGREEAWLRERLDQHRRMPGPIEQKLTNGRWLRIVERETSDGGRVGLHVDITTLKEQQYALRRLAITDELTGLRNRRNLLEDIALLADDLRDGQCVVVFHMDLDRFKSVNDVYGHAAGDHVLKHCAALLEGAVMPGDITARVGGDEYIVVRRMARDTVAVTAFADQIIARMMEPIGYAGQYMHIGASVGIAVLDPDTVASLRGTVLSAADLALCEAKKTGCCAVIFEAAMREQVLSTSALARDLQLAMKRQEFVAHFQPQIDAGRGCCVGFEALLRWRHPRDGIVAAGAFLDVAQRAGLTESLDALMLDAACHALRWLADHGWPHVSVSINMSKAQLSDPRLLSRLIDSLSRHGVSRHLLRIELLESTLLDERAGHFVDNVKAMVAAGFVVELDDFGTGHAAIAALRKFQVSQIKIDRSFVRDIDTDTELQKLTGAIVGMAHSLDIDVLAEGVETQAERDWLSSAGCTLMQGWFYGKAVPLPEVATLLARWPATGQPRINVSPKSMRGVS